MRMPGCRSRLAACLKHSHCDSLWELLCKGRGLGRWVICWHGSMRGLLGNTCRAMEQGSPVYMRSSFSPTSAGADRMTGARSSMLQGVQGGGGLAARRARRGAQRKVRPLGSAEWAV